MNTSTVTTGARVLAIDLGTSSTRAALFGLDGWQAGETARQDYPLVTGGDGQAELRVDDLRQALHAVIDQVLAAAGDAPITAVGLSSFWHSLVAVDDGLAPLTPVLTWADRRAGPEAAALRPEHEAAGLHARTGCPPHSSFWTAKLPWLSHLDPTLAAATRHWLSAADLLLAELTGMLRTSTSLASGTGLLDLASARWQPQALRLAGVDPQRLPVIDDRPRRGLAPAFARRWPALREAVWLPVTGDGACSNLGAGAADGRSLVLMLGTSGSMRMLWNEADESRPLTDPGLWCYRVDRRRLAGGMALSEGGASAEWVRRTFTGLSAGPALDARIDRMAPDAHGLTILPWVLGARSPSWRDDRTASLVGLTAATTADEVYRAMLESIGLRFAALKARLDACWPPATRILATGGALTNSPAWCRIVADCIGEDIEVADTDEASLRGAACLAIESCTGALPGPPVGDGPPRRFRADPAAHARYRQARIRQERLAALLAPD